jgi:hypothetical protein
VEVERLTQAFSSHAELIYLRLNVWRLTPDLIELLARNFSGLEKLTLNIADEVIEVSLVTFMFSPMFTREDAA